MPLNEEHEILKRLKPHVNDPVVHDMLALIKLYETKALDKLVDAKGANVDELQGEIKILRKVTARIKTFDSKSA